MKKTVKFLLRSILIIILALAAWYFGTIIYHKITFDRNAELVDKDSVIDDDFKVDDIEGNEISPRVDGELLFLLAGLDQNSGVSGENTRSDTLMLIKANFKSGETNIISIPRDTRVPVLGNLDKINHASAYGGIGLTMRTVRDWLDIDLDYYAVVNFETVKHLVDVLGGVEVEVPGVMAQMTNLEAGLQRLDGEDALTYVRFRKGYPEGDIGRVKAQQVFMTALMKEVSKPKNIAKAPVFIDIFFKEVNTNIPSSLVLSNGFNLPKFSSSKLEIDTIPGYGDYYNGVSYYFYQESETFALRDRVLGQYILSR